mmetsp:Transcript_45062/g.65878  ORF Transcript_45062/g.65878 Transcript_45062/m.65878 type:complete len:159 (-) Transcript_45062:375-851(-)
MAKAFPHSAEVMETISASARVYHFDSIIRFFELLGTPLYVASRHLMGLEKEPRAQRLEIPNMKGSRRRSVPTANDQPAPLLVEFEAEAQMMQMERKSSKAKINSTKKEDLVMSQKLRKEMTRVHKSKAMNRGEPKHMNRNQLRNRQSQMKGSSRKRAI